MTKLEQLEQLEQTAKELLAEIEELKATTYGVANHNMDFRDIQIDLNNTWCEATEENYKALVKLGLRGSRFNKDFKYLLIDIDKFYPIDILNGTIEDIEDKKQIQLVNGKFEFVK